jgi:glycosyltransferase involved in cell wall biosynthesis
LSSFCQNAISQKAPIPVIRMSPAVEVKLERNFSREDFGLPSGKFLFLTIFDVLSVLERKNPLAVIEAFIRALPSGGNSHLVLKVNNARRRPDCIQLLRERAAGHSITILDRAFTRNEVNGLIQVCDCLVSLHRSEGFGLTLAEAMFLGKPVIATRYSGNLDFTLPDNSFLVGYRVRPVGKGCEPYDENCVWADPIVDDAAECMRIVSSCPEARSRIAQNGQSHVRQFLSREAVGARVRARLETLQAMQGNPDAVPKRRGRASLLTRRAGAS